MNRKKVLIITYYWPPSGGSGVQRWLKFTKYLRKFGWEPVIYTPENPEAPATDESLHKDIPEGIEVIQRPIWEPYSFYKRFTGQKKEARVGTGFLAEEKKPGLAEKIAVWIRGNLFIPDARKYWIKPSVRFLTSYLKAHPVDTIVSTGPPHSMHLIAMGVRNKTHIPWLADFRDPWTEIDFYDELMLSKWADRKHHKLELEVLNHSDRITVVSPTMKKEFEVMASKQVDLLTNGFDDEDYTDEYFEPDKKFTLAHIGTMVQSRNPIVLWEALSGLKKTNPELIQHFRFKLIGKVDISILETAKEYKLDSLLEKIDYVPHDEVIRQQRQSQVLLMILNNTRNAKGILTGKFFEYMAAKRPIICIGPSDSDTAKILKELDVGYVVGFEDVGKMKEVLIKLYDAYTKNEDFIEQININRYSRRSLTERLASILNELAP